jgi:hypothetical protein
MPCELVTSICNKPQADRKDLFFQRFVFKHQRFVFVMLNNINKLANDNPNRSTILAVVDLRGASPAAIQQDACRRHARRRWRGLLADDPGKHLDA